MFGAFLTVSVSRQPTLISNQMVQNVWARWQDSDLLQSKVQSRFSFRLLNINGLKIKPNFLYSKKLMGGIVTLPCLTHPLSGACILQCSCWVQSGPKRFAYSPNHLANARLGKFWSAKENYILMANNSSNDIISILVNCPMVHHKKRGTISFWCMHSSSMSHLVFFIIFLRISFCVVL